DPGADYAVETIMPANGLVYVGGDFDHIGGQPRGHIAALDPVSGLATAWDPHADGLVKTLGIKYTAFPPSVTIFVGGYFTLIGGQLHNSIAAVDAGTGQVLSWDPGANGSVDALVVSGKTLYVGGRFTLIGGQWRSHVAALDTGGGLANSWDPSANDLVTSLIATGGTIYAAGAFTSIGGQPRT